MFRSPVRLRPPQLMAKVSRLILPAPLPHQGAVLSSPARYVLVRAGRRWGKSRMALLASLMGWGKERKGALQGGEIVWLCPDYPQSRAIWREEIDPRCQGVAGVSVREQERRVEFPGSGALELRSAEAIDGLRGRRLDGVVVDEGAHLDLEYAWTVVLRPALLDRSGWALFPSTPNAGQDGNAGKRAPSYFNILCAREMRGELGGEWAQFHGPTEDNRALGPEEVAALRAEYPGDSLTVRQEIDADLVVGGAGLAFACWRHEVHVVDKAWEPVAEATWCGGLDFGFRASTALCVGAIDREGRVVVADECYFNGLYAEEAGRRIAKTCEKWPGLRLIAADSAMWAQTGAGPTVAEEVRRGMTSVLGERTPALFPVVKAGSEGRSSREAGFQLVQRYLAFRAEKDGTVAPWNLPLLRFHPRAANHIRTFPGLPFAPNGNEDVDTDADDHCYDCVRYMLSSRPPVPAALVRRPEADDHPGFDYAAGERKVKAYERAWRREEPRREHFLGSGTLMEEVG